MAVWVTGEEKLEKVDTVWEVDGHEYKKLNA